MWWISFHRYDFHFYVELSKIMIRSFNIGDKLVHLSPFIFITMPLGCGDIDGKGTWGVVT